jgi:hypothetical protein
MLPLIIYVETLCKALLTSGNPIRQKFDPIYTINSNFSCSRRQLNPLLLRIEIAVGSIGSNLAQVPTPHLLPLIALCRH